MDLENLAGETFEFFQEGAPVPRPRGACCAACGAAAELDLEQQTSRGVDAPPLALAPGMRVLLVGDSHTYGAFGQELQRLLAEQQLNVLRRAKIGSAVKYWWPRLPALLQEQRPDVVILALGANMRGYPSARGTAAQIQKTVALVRQARPNATIVWIGPPRLQKDSDAELARFNRIIQRGLGTAAHFIDSAPLTPRYVGRDGVHYAAKEGKLWARAVVAALSASPSKELEDEVFESRAFEAFEDEAAAPADVQAFAERLGKEWSRRRGGKPTPEAMTSWLLQDHGHTLTGARQRWTKLYGKGRFSVANLSRAWMVSREANMRFQGEFSALPHVAKLAPPSVAVPLVSSALIEDSEKAPVAPIMVKFMQALKQRFSAVRASNYRGHGGGSFNGRGHSLDLFLKGLDERGFYRKGEAVRLLHAVHDAAVAVGAEWRVIYNDFDVARVVNRALGRQHVLFVGTTRRVGNNVKGLNWHGPDPLILHFHLDLSPANGPSRSRWNDRAEAAPSQEAEATSPARSSSVKVDPKVVARIDRYRELIEGAAKQAGVSPHVIRGIIAAESSGDPKVGAGGKGYKGLMQCETGPEQLDPEVSIRCGAIKYAAFTKSMRKYLAGLKQDFDRLPEDTRIRIVTASYNAGPRTVQLAMKFASDSGDLTKWTAPEHYLRAVLTTGAYATSVGALRWCLKTHRLTVADLVADLARLSGKAEADLRPRYAPGGQWSTAVLLERLPAWLRLANKKLRNRGDVPLERMRATAPKSLLCTADFKQSHTSGYIDTILRYARHSATR